MVPTGQMQGMGASSLTAGILSAHLCGNAELFSLLAPEAPIVAALRSPEISLQRRAREEAPQTKSFQQALAFLSGLTTAESGASTGPLSSFQRAEVHIRKIKAGIDRALQDPDLGDFAPLLQQIVTKHPSLSSGHVKDWRAAGDLPTGFVDGLRDDMVDLHAEYTGTTSLQREPAFRRQEAVRRALKALFSQAGEHLYLSIRCEALAVVLKRHDETLSTRFHEMEHMELFAEAKRLSRELQETLFGSQQRMDVSYRNLAIEYEILSRPDFELQTYGDLVFEQTYKALSAEDLSYFNDLKTRLAESGRVLSGPAQLELIKGIEYFYRRAQDISLTEAGALRFVYFDVTQELALLALQNGVPRAAIDNLVDRLGTSPQTTQVRMADIYERPLELAPAALPAPIKQVLKETGHWEAIQSVERIVLMPNLEASEQVKQIVGSVPHGRTYFMDRTIVIATQDSGELMTANGQIQFTTKFDEARIAGLIRHEAGHVNAMREQEQDSDVRFLTNVVQEREAYSWEARFYKDYLDTYGERLTPVQIADLEEKRFNCELIVHACNLLLGIPVRNVEPGAVPSRDETIYARFAATAETIDWDAYATWLVDLIGWITFSGEEQKDLFAVRDDLASRVEALTPIIEEMKADTPDNPVQEREQFKQQLMYDQLKQRLDRLNHLVGWTRFVGPDPLSLIGLRDELRRGVERIVELNHKKYDYIRQQTNQKMRPIRPLLRSASARANFDQLLPALIMELQQKKNQAQHGRFRKVLDDVRQVMGVEVEPEQVAHFLSSYPFLVELQRQRWNLQLGLDFKGWAVSDYLSSFRKIPSIIT